MPPYKVPTKFREPFTSCKICIAGALTIGVGLEGFTAYGLVVTARTAQDFFQVIFNAPLEQCCKTSLASRFEKIYSYLTF